MDSHEEILNLINTWHFRAQKIQRSHYDASALCDRQNTFLSIPIIIISAVTGTSQIANLITSDIAGIFSLFVALLAGIQMFMGYSQKAARHKIAASQYGAMRRALEEMKTRIDDDTINIRHELTAIRKQFDALAMESPVAPLKILKRHGHDPEKDLAKYKAPVQ